ncbi:hypothetical protein [Lamprobacter modestohalophilus]|uniref:hypothetical protein n=1 Tax=Lamprobacter modestohalophilus TaxID=1064514 RepID=UPI001907EF35|nr:hypothetical protein [Lamprobacter modestohalophilus]
MQNIKFSECIVRKTIPGSYHCAWNTKDAYQWPGPIYEYTFYLCKHNEKNDYYLFYTYDRYERGHWEETEDEGYLPITPQLAETIADENTVTDDKISLEGLLESLQETSNKIETHLSNTIHYPDLRNDLAELNSCLNIKAYRATLAIAGRILELCLKMQLVIIGREVEKDWMVGKLLREIEDSDTYFDPAIKNMWNIINQQRIIGVHAKEQAPIPSKNQAYMVSFAVLDVLDRVAERAYSTTNS